MATLYPPSAIYIIHAGHLNGLTRNG